MEMVMTQQGDEVKVGPKTEAQPEEQVGAEARENAKAKEKVNLAARLGRIVFWEFYCCSPCLW